MKYYIPSLDIFVNGAADNEIDGVIYPRNSIQKFFIDAVAKPIPGEHERIIPGASGWEVEPWTQQEIDDYEAAQVEAKVDKIWSEHQAFLSHPRTGLDPVEATVINDLSKGSNSKARAVKDWAQALYDEAVSREATVRAGGDPGEWITSKTKPFTLKEAQDDEQ